jgi:hypothetical protein
MADSKSGMNLPSRTSAVLTDLRSGISGSIQDTARLKQEWTSLGQVIQSAGSKAGSLVKSGSGMQSSSKIAPDPNFGQQQQPSNNQVFSSPAQTAIGGGQGGGGQIAVPGGGEGYGGGGGGGGMFRNLSDYVSQNKTGAILYGAGTALMGAQSTSDMVEAQLLMQRNAAFMTRNPGAGSILDRISSTTDPFGALSANGQGNLTNQYEYTRRSAAKMADRGGANDPMDSYRAMAAAQSYGINGPNFMQRAGTRDQFEGSVMSGVSNVSNLVPGMGLEGTTRAYGGMQRARSVNMLKGVGINIRDEQGNMKPMDVIIDDLWKKITRDVSKDGRGSITEQQMLIAFQPGNSMDSMVQNLFGDDPLVYTAIKNGLLYKARTGGAAITQEGALDAGFTTKAVQTKQRKEALGTRGIGNVSNAGAASYGGVQGLLNDFSEVALTADDIAGLLGPLKIFNGLAAALQTAGGAGGGMGASVMGFITALLGKISGKAEGGSVGNKTPYIVGEKGPELFIPKTDGVIIPNDLGPTRHKGGGVTAGGDQTPLSDQKLRGILSGAGFTGQALDDAMKIARWESGGIPGRHSDPSLKKDDSHGLFQINMLGTLGPARRKKYGLKSDDDLYDPETNARVAYTIFKGSGNRFDKAWITNSAKLDDKGRPGFGPDNRGSGDTGSADGSTTTQTDNPFEAGSNLEKAYNEYLKTNTISDSTVAGLLKSGGTGASSTGINELFASMGGGSTVNYGGVTFNITTPADNKSFIESIKKALGDLNLGKLIGNK